LDTTSGSSNRHFAGNYLHENSGKEIDDFILTRRDAFASLLVMAEVDLFTFGKLLGHRHPTMTQRYSHLSPGHSTRQ
jgi:site-specific recombinase XerD